MTKTNLIVTNSQGETFEASPYSIIPDREIWISRNALAGNGSGITYFWYANQLGGFEDRDGNRFSNHTNLEFVLNHCVRKEPMAGEEVHVEMSDTLTQLLKSNDLSHLVRIETVAKNWMIEGREDPDFAARESIYALIRDQLELLRPEIEVWLVLDAELKRINDAVRATI